MEVFSCRHLLRGFFTCVTFKNLSLSRCSGPLLIGQMLKCLCSLTLTDCRQGSCDCTSSQRRLLTLLGVASYQIWYLHFKWLPQLLLSPLIMTFCGLDWTKCITFLCLQSDLRGKLGFLDGKIMKNEAVLSQMTEVQKKLKVTFVLTFTALNQIFDINRHLKCSWSGGLLTGIGV